MGTIRLTNRLSIRPLCIIIRIVIMVVTTIMIKIIDSVILSDPVRRRVVARVRFLFCHHHLPHLLLLLILLPLLLLLPPLCIISHVERRAPSLINIYSPLLLRLPNQVQRQINNNDKNSNEHKNNNRRHSRLE